MTREYLLGSQSPDRDLVVKTAPYGEVLDFVCPDYVVVGTYVPMGVRVRNTGGSEEDFQVSIWEETYPGGPVEVARSGSIRLAVGAESWFWFDHDAWLAGDPQTYDSIVMPDRDITLIAHALHYIPFFQWGWDGSAQHSVLSYVEVLTALTLTLEPVPVSPGADYKYKGRLTRTDTGAGLGTMTIHAFRAGVEVGTGTTDASGNYEITLKAPTALGTYVCMATFLGVSPFAAVETEMVLTVVAYGAPQPLLGALAIATGTVGLLFVKVR